METEYVNNTDEPVVIEYVDEQGETAVLSVGVDATVVVTNESPIRDDVEASPMTTTEG